MSDKEQRYNFRAPVSLARRKSDEGKKKEYSLEKSDAEQEQYRTEFMRDRDRILYCSSFRRLDGKTQIYRTGGNDHQRNRMTHTLEVAQLSRTIATALKLDSDLAEAIALGHDLGHSPFGHAGEEVLHRIMMASEANPISDSPLKTKWVSKKMVPYTGFKHNIQSVRIITELDNSYEDDDPYVNYGLNLTNFTLWGIMHHSEMDYSDGKTELRERLKTCPYGNNYASYIEHSECRGCEAWSFEAFVVKQADEIAQWHHDLEDALRGNAITSIEVCDTVEAALGDRLKDNAEKLKELKKKNRIDKPYLAKFSHIVIDTLVNWLITCSKENLNYLWNEWEKNGKGENFFFNHKWDEPKIKHAIGFFPILMGEYKSKDEYATEELKKQFNDNIHEKIHHSQPVERMNAKGKFVIEQLFKSYYAAPQQLPTSILIQYLLELEKEGKIPNELKKEEIKREKDKVVTIGDVVSSWDKAWDAGTGAVRICFKEVWAEAKKTQKVLLMRKICDHIAGMTDHFALEEYKNLCG